MDKTKKHDRVYFEKLIKVNNKDHDSFLYNPSHCKLYLKGTFVGEYCENVYDRFSAANMRLKAEKRILDFVGKHFAHKPISILSMGADFFLQDFMLLPKLVKKGATNINLVMVEADANDETHQLVYQQFNNLLDDLRLAYPEVEINVQLKNDLQHLNPDFNIVYALNDAQANLLVNHNSSSYLAMKEAIDAMQLLKYDAQPCLGFFTFGNNFYNVTADNSDELVLPSVKSCTNAIANLDTIKIFYINNDLNYFLTHLSYFIAANKTIWLNEALVKPEDIPCLSQLMEKFNINFQCVSEQTALSLISKSDENEKIFVADYIFLMAEKELSPNMNYSHIYMPKSACNETFIRENAVSKCQKNHPWMQVGLLQRLEALNQDEQISRLLNDFYPIRSAGYRFFTRSHLLSLKTYLQDLAEGDRTSKDKCSKILTALEAKDGEALLVALQIRRHTYDIFGSTTGEKLYNTMLNRKCP